MNNATMTVIRTFLLVLLICGSVLTTNPSSYKAGQSLIGIKLIGDLVFFIVDLFRKNGLNRDHNAYLTYLIIHKTISVVFATSSVVTAILNMSSVLGFALDIVSILCDIPLCLYENETTKDRMLGFFLILLGFAASFAGLFNTQLALCIICSLEVLSAFLDYMKWLVEMLKHNSHV